MRISDLRVCNVIAFAVSKFLLLAHGIFQIQKFFVFHNATQRKYMVLNNKGKSYANKYTFIRA